MKYTCVKFKTHGLMIFIFISLMLIFPDIAAACDPKPHAKKYINQIRDVFGGEKPGLVIEEDSSEEILAFYDREEKIIHIYKDDYKGSCEENLPKLRVVIAHEYAHHLNSKIRKIAPIDGRENLAETAEHAIANAIWGEDKVVFDDDLNQQYLQQYKKIFSHVKSKIIKNRT
ncbi:MAG: hypothetical protein ACD_5C00050G0004 [uncultured bacterium]|nr:MAG: hypothetical protein ACD_5C00050G0004 [uncultured bacterium]